MCSLNVCIVLGVLGPKGAGPGTRMMDRGGQLIAPLLTDTHGFFLSHTHRGTHLPNTCPPWGSACPWGHCPGDQQSPKWFCMPANPRKVWKWERTGKLCRAFSNFTLFFLIFFFCLAQLCTCVCTFSVGLPATAGHMFFCFTLLAAVYAMMTSGPLGGFLYIH